MIAMPLCRESRLALVFGSILGCAAVALVPPFSAPDGQFHFERAASIANGAFRAEIYSPSQLGGALPARDIAFVDHVWAPNSAAHDGIPTVTHWIEAAHAGGADDAPRRVEFTNTAVYSPVNYIFSATGMALASMWTDSPLVADRLGCLFNVAGYLFLIVIALELLPRAKRLCLLLAFTPLNFLQAASLSTDALNLALPLLLLAWTWRLREQETDVDARQLAGLGLLGLMVVLLKPTAIAWLICFAALPARHFATSRRKIAALAGYAALAAVVFFAWNYPYLGVDIARWFFPGRPPIEEVRAVLLASPASTVGMIWEFLSDGLWQKLPHLYGNAGLWIHADLLRAMRFASAPFLLAAVLSIPAPTRRDHAWAGIVACQSLAGFGFMCVTLLFTYGEPGRLTIPYMGARYLPFVVIGLLLAASEWLPRRLAPWGPTCWLIAWTTNGACIGAVLLSTALRVL